MAPRRVSVRSWSSRAVSVQRYGLRVRLQLQATSIWDDDRAPARSLTTLVRPARLSCSRIVTYGVDLISSRVEPGAREDRYRTSRLLTRSARNGGPRIRTDRAAEREHHDAQPQRR